jgi:uncharacterized protein (DUF58 family)
MMLSAEEARLLDRLILSASSASPSAAASGLRRAASRGVGIEFQDYRHYEPGDDPRLIDWTVEARLRQLVIRVSRAEGHLRLHLLLDVSRSMAIGAPDKLCCARKVAAALCYIAIARRDAVAVATFDETIRHHLPLGAGRAQLSRVFEVLRAAVGNGRSGIDRSLMAYGAAVRGPGVAVVFSDFFQDASDLQGLRYLLHRGITPVVMHVLAPDELDPRITEETSITDIENPDSPPLTIGPSAMRAYHERLSHLSKRLGDFCAANRLPYIPLSSSDPFERLLHACERASLIGAYA